MAFSTVSIPKITASLFNSTEQHPENPGLNSSNEIDDIEMRRRCECHLSKVVSVLESSGKLHAYSTGKTVGISEYWKFLIWLSGIVTDDTFSALNCVWKTATSTSDEKYRASLSALANNACALIHAGYSKASFTTISDVCATQFDWDTEKLESLREVFFSRCVESAVWRIRWDLLRRHTAGAEVVRALLASYLYEKHHLLGFGVEDSPTLKVVRRALFASAMLVGFDTYSLTPQDLLNFDSAINDLASKLAEEAEVEQQTPLVAIKPISGRVSISKAPVSFERNICFSLAPVLRLLEEEELHGGMSVPLETFQRLALSRINIRRRRSERQKVRTYWPMLVGTSQVLRGFQGGCLPGGFPLHAEVIDLSSAGARVQLDGEASLPDLHPGELAMGGFLATGDMSVSVVRWVRREAGILEMGLSFIGQFIGQRDLPGLQCSQATWLVEFSSELRRFLIFDSATSQVPSTYVENGGTWRYLRDERLSDQLRILDFGMG